MRTTLWRVGLAVVVLLGTVASLAITSSQEKVSQEGPRGIRHVVVFAVPGLGLADVDPAAMPRLAGLAGRGAIAAANVRTLGDRPDLTEAYGSLGAGNRIGEGETAAVAYGADESINGVRAGDLIFGDATATAEDGIVVPAIDLLRAERVPSGGSGIGALGDALHAVGRTTAVVANQDQTAPDGSPSRSTPAALAVVDHNGRIDGGLVSEGLLDTDVPTPRGPGVDEEAFVAAVARALDTADVVVADPGVTVRAAAATLDPAGDGVGEADLDGDVGEAEDDEQVRARRHAALATTDALIGRVARRLPGDALLLVVGVTPPGDRWALTPVVAVGDRVPAGFLDSPSTQRPGLVTLTDLAPTILDALGVAPDDAMIGRPLRYRPGPASFDDAGKLDDLLRRRDPVDHPTIGVFVALQVVLYVLAIGLLIRRRAPGRTSRILELAVLACAAWPLATFVLRFSMGLYSLGWGTVALAWLLAAVIAAAAQRLRAHPLDPVLAICGATVALIVLDLGTGAHLQVGSIFGYTPHTAPRYRGVGNASFALLGGSTIVIASALIARARNLAVARAGAAAVVAAVILADGAPWMGADVGGILALVPVLAMTLWVLHGRRLRWRTLAIAMAVTAGVLAVVVGFEARLAPDDRSHIGRFFLNAGDGPLVWATLRRKWDLNMRILGEALWSWLVPVLAGGAAYLLLVRRAWQRYLPDGSPERTAVLATLAMGTAGWLLNDSGVMVLALTTIYLGPYILLLALRGPNRMGTEPAATPPERGAPEGRPEGDSVTDPMAADEIRTPAPSAGATVVAIVPAFERADSVGATVRSLAAIAAVSRVLVVDDGSTDDTVEAARAAGADVLRLPVNRGKGAAVNAGIAATPDADIYLFIDADLAGTAATAAALLDPVLAGRADLTVGVLPSAGGRGGFGTVRTMAARGIQRACGAVVRAPLSGQRAVRAELVRDLRSAERFGLEVAMTIDVVRAGGRLLEIDVPMDHRHTGRSLAGFRHRGNQGVDILRSLWPRLTSRPVRLAVPVVGAILLLAIGLALSSREGVTSEPLATTPERVLVYGMAPFGFDDLGSGHTPNLDRLVSQGSVGAMTVRSTARSPMVTEGYLALGAGARVRSAELAGAVVGADLDMGTGTAAEYIGSLTGEEPDGDLVVLGGPGTTKRNAGPEVASPPGTLGDALADAGLSGAVVANSDQPESFVEAGTISRPAGLAVMGSDYAISHGTVDPEQLLEADPDAPFGVRADLGRFATAARTELARSSVVVVDPGELARAERYAATALKDAAARHWSEALERTDALLGDLVADLDDDTLVLVVSTAPPGGAYRLTPVVAWGAGVPVGTIASPSTKRLGVTAITDLAPTILAALAVPAPEELPGNALRYHPGTADLGALRGLDDETSVREATYGGQSNAFIYLNGIVYGVALVLLLRRPGRAGGGAEARWARVVRWAALALAAYPVATFLIRLVPDGAALLGDAHPLVAAVLAGLIALAAGGLRRHPLAPLAAVLALTMAVVVVDTWTGTHLHLSSWLGYSLHSAGRFYGLPNTTFGVLGAAALLWAGIHMTRSDRPDEAVWNVGAVLAVVLLSAGLPMLGADVGSLITLFPIFAILVMVLAGRRVRFRTLVIAGLAVAALLAVAAGLDLARPAASRSHLGRFAQDFLDNGPSTLVDSFQRKQSANLRILQGSSWSMMVPIVAAFSLHLLFWQRRRRELLPNGSPLLAAVVAVVAAAALGFASNDSGPVVVALFLAYIPPVLVLLALAPPDGDPVLLTADRDPASVAVT